MRIMAIDYGDAHTGVAVSDLTGLLAGFTTTIHTRKQEEVLDRLGALISEYGVAELVLGYPKNMDGTLGPRAEKAEAMARILTERFGMSGAPPLTPITSSLARAKTRRSGKRPWTPWRRR